MPLKPMEIYLNAHVITWLRAKDADELVIDLERDRSLVSSKETWNSLPF